jgi:hypothetical protein
MWGISILMQLGGSRYLSLGEFAASYPFLLPLPFVPSPLPFPFRQN